MRKNVASQKIGCQMTTAADGTNFTGTVTCYVTLDAGAQGLGSVGSGVCTHEGNGYHTYAPAQAETNGDLAAFTFIGTGAVSATVQVFTTSLNPHDTVRGGMTSLPNAAADAAGGLPISDAGGLDLDTKLANTNEVTAARMGALTDWINGGRLDLILDIIAADTTSDIPATLATIAAYLDTEVAAIKAKTDNLPFDPADASDIAASFSSIASTLTTIATYIDTEVAAIKAKTDNLPSDPADASDVAASFSTVSSTLSTIAGYLDTEIAAIKAKTDNLPAAPAAVGDIPTAAQNSTAVWTTQLTEAYAANGVAPTGAQGLFALHQMLMTFAITGTSYTVKKLDGSTTAFVVTLNDATTPTAVTRA